MPDQRIYERHLAELRVELEACEAQARKLRALISMYEEMTGERRKADDAASVQGDPKTAADISVAEHRPFRIQARRPMVPSALFRSVTKEIIRSVGRPMLRDEIKDQLAERGIVFGGKKPENAVSTQLYRARDEFRVVPGQGYWFAGEPVPEAATYQANAGPHNTGNRIVTDVSAGTVVDSADMALVE